MGITRPNFNDLNPYKYYTTTSDYVSGNPDLRPSVAHNAEINYSFKGIYAVLYNSYNNDAIGYITRFNNDGSQYTIPEIISTAIRQDYIYHITVLFRMVEHQPWRRVFPHICQIKTD